MTAGTTIEVRKIAYRQSKDGMVLSLLVHNDDMTPELASAPLGTRYAVALVEIGDDEHPIERNKQNPLVQRAGILCNEILFQTFIEEEFPLDWDEEKLDTKRSVPEITASVLRKNCEIESRRDLANNPEGAMKFERLLAKYEMWKRGQ